MSKDLEFLRKLRETFRLEAGEHLQVIETALLELESAPGPETQRRVVETAFRAAHSLKGAARAVDYIEVETACQALEDMFAAWTRDPNVRTAATLDALHRRLDAVSATMRTAGEPEPTDEAAAAPTASEPRRHAPAPPRSPRTYGVVPPADETVRVSVATLDARLIEAEEMLTAKLAAGQRVTDLRDLKTDVESWRTDASAVEPQARLLQATMQKANTGSAVAEPLSRLLQFVESNRDQLKALEDRVGRLHKMAELDHQIVGRLVDALLESSKKLLLLPFGTIAVPLPKLVRDLSRDLGKEAELTIRGQEIRMDKRVLEEIKDPLLHLLRNAVDHGIEDPGTRQRAGKPRRGSITIAASQSDGDRVHVVVTDDGAGIDPERVRASALERGHISAEEARELSDTEAPRLIFEADVSTSAGVTRLSGRGLGLAIVREKVMKLGGTVSVESAPGKGTQFVLMVPSTLATFRGVVVSAANRLFVVPSQFVERVVRLAPGDVRTVEGRDTVAIGGRAVALVGLADVLDLPGEASDTASASPSVLLVLGTRDQRLAASVDAVLDEQEVLAKPLRPPLSRVRNVAAVAVLGAGQVVPILNVDDLLVSAKTRGVPLDRKSPAAPAATAAKSVLVAEDSITSRMLIRSILESAGYRVTTAVDGLEAVGLLRTGHFDAVVTDVEMPRLNGFELAARIRADERLAQLPIVLVTALDSPEDRARGIDVGADAYIVKRSFDQSDLLDTLRRLI